MEAIGQLAGGVAHDFNNILTVIIGYSDLLLSGAGGESPICGDIEEIRNAATRAANLTSQLLAFSRKQILQPRILDLNAVVADSIKMLRRLIGENIELVTLLDPSIGRVKIDPSQIEQVIVNLAVNARDAMLNGGNLTIETQNVYLDEKYARSHIGVHQGHYVMLAISDTGCGMNAETQAHLFEPFFTTKEEGRGTGLGLSMVYGIVKQSGGSICVYSEMGRGTVFKVYLPKRDEPASRVLKPTIASQIPHGTETILLVEDNPMLLRLSRTILMTIGYKVMEAGNGEDACRICKTCHSPIHLLVTDMVMPAMGGSELAKRLASLRPEMRVLFMSGYTDGAIIQNAVLEAGAAFLQKPFTLETLARKVREVLASSNGPHYHGRAGDRPASVSEIQWAPAARRRSKGPVRRSGPTRPR